MKENVEVVVKVGFDNKEMSIMTTSINNVKYSTGTCNGNVYIYRLSIRNARIMSNKHREYNAEYGCEYYTTFVGGQPYVKVKIKTSEERLMRDEGDD